MVVEVPGCDVAISEGQWADPTGQIDQQSLALLGVTSGSSSGAGGQQSKQPASSDQQQGSYGEMGNQGGPGQQANPQQGVKFHI